MLSFVPFLAHVGRKPSSIPVMNPDPPPTPGFLSADDGVTDIRVQSWLRQVEAATIPYVLTSSVGLDCACPYVQSCPAMISTLLLATFRRTIRRPGPGVSRAFYMHVYGH